MMKIIVSLIFICQQAVAGLPPTTAKGQSETNPVTTFNFQAPYNQETTTSSATRLVETGNENMLANPSFETGDTTGWTNGAFSAASVTSIVASGKKAEGFSVNATGAITTQTLTPTIKLTGRQLVASAWVRSITPVGTQICAMDAGNEVGCTAYPEIDQTWSFIQVPFIAADGDAIGLRIKSTDATSRTVYVDQAYVGLINLGTSSVNTGWVQFDPTSVGSQGFGTLAANSCFWRRDNTDMLLDCKITAGTVAASEARLTLPSSAIIDPVAVPTLRLALGSWARSTASGTTVKRGTILINGSNTYINFSNDDYTGTVNPLVVQNGSAIFSSSDVISIKAQIPIQGWGSLSAINPSQAGSMWSGYHDNTCSWARTNAAYGDPTADASCALVQRTNNNFGSVTSYNSAGSPLPGVVFVPASTGLYWVCANAKIAGGTLASTLDMRLWDGTTVIAEAEAQTYVATDIEAPPLCGLYSATAGASTTLSVQTRATSGSVTIATASTNASAIEWTIVNLTYTTPAPLLIGAVTNGGQKVSVHFAFTAAGSTVTTDCGTGACTVYNATGATGLTVNNAGGAVYTVTVPAGTCSTALNCAANTHGTALIVAAPVSAATATTFVWATVNSAFAAANGVSTVQCDCTK